MVESSRPATAEKHMSLALESRQLSVGFVLDQGWDDTENDYSPHF